MIETQYWISINQDGSLFEWLIIPSEDPLAELPYNAFQVTEQQYLEMQAGYYWVDGDTLEELPSEEEIPPEPPAEDTGITWEEALVIYGGADSYWVLVDNAGYLTEYLIIPSEDPLDKKPYNAFEVDEEQFAKLIAGWIWVIDDVVDPNPPVEPPIDPPIDPDPSIITPGESKIVHAGLVEELISIKWLVTIRDLILVKERGFEVRTTLLSPIQHSTYGILGDRIPHSLDVVITGEYVELRITNNEVHDIHAYALPHRHYIT